MKQLRIGIVGSGGIAVHFANACKAVDGVEAVGVYSRSAENRKAFLAKTGLAKAYGTLEEMVEDSAVDLVYVATPHAAHYQTALKALQSGKHVLCEKPMTLSVADSQSLFDEAQKRGLFLMEGMWSRFLPVTEQATRWLRDERIGPVRLIDAVFSFRIEPKIPRLFDPAVGGGALYDVGVYALEMASWYAGQLPCQWQGVCNPYCQGVDAFSAVTLRYPSGLLATLRVGIDCEIPEEMTLCGDKGLIRIPKFHRPNEAFLLEGQNVTEHLARPFQMPEGFTWQIAHVRDCIASGQISSRIVPPQDTLSAAQITEDLMHSFFPQ